MADLDDILDDEERRLEEARQRLAATRELRSLKAEVRSLRAEARALAEALERREVELDAVTHLYEAQPLEPLKPAAVNRRRSESALIALASDWHVEEIVEPRTVGGLNAYNPDVAKERAVQFFRSVLDVARMARAHTAVDELVLVLAGDFITGHIHDELVASTAMGPLDASEYAYRLLRQGIDLLLDQGDFRRVTLPCVAGNHGRITHRRWVAHEGGTNLEIHIYRRLAHDFREDPRVQFSISESVYNEECEVYGRRLRVCHGETLSYRGGLQGAYGRVYKVHTERNRVTAPCFWTLAGHYHTLRQFHDCGWINGSLIGTSAYGSKFGHEDPVQGWGLIDRDRGCTAVGPLHVQ